MCNGALASARKVDLEGEQSGSTLALCVRALFVFASLLHSICVLIMFFSPLCLSASFPHVSMQERRKVEHLALSRVPNSLSFFCSDYRLPPNLTTRCPHRSAIPFHTEACKLLSRHIKREKMLLFFFLRSVFRLSFLQPAPRRLHIQFPHLYLGPCEEQGDISAVLSGEDSHRLLSVLDVHSIYLTREREQNKIELMLDNQRGLYTKGQDSIKPLHPGNSSSLELQR